ncbi:uncharacterized protein Triagg1_3749 [Trichoderma aggressivum f. europaeum]|uniref:Protein kinase domain-containing protein n=1 Tax=Trichoderma aggressivum f. europaeum TaxID=173218 RepID=A0AAE1IER0_9HYPO|nr:hypothetical protein Triagg1_3749 [Trichoderma aggressivum f. europaeum]
MSDNVPIDLALSITSCVTHVEEEAQQQAMWALPETQSNGGIPELLQQQEEDGKLQNLRQYLASCHNMNQAAQTLNSDSCCSQATTLEPEGKLYPAKITSSPDFMDKQMEVWNVVLADDNSALLKKMFPSMEQVHDEYFSMEPVNGQPTLCVFERLGISKAVMNLLHGVLDDEVLSSAVGLRGDITYGPLDEDDDSIVEDDESEFEQHCSFCVYSNTECGRHFPVVGVEYRPSDPPMVQEITTALVEDIFPERDVIGREDDSYTFVSSSKQVITAIITQLFDRMVKSGVPYGYIYTGEAIIFLEIHDDPSIAHCYVSIPDNDVSAEDESTLRYSAVGQIFAFMIRAMQAGPRSVQWHDRTATLDVWRSSRSEALLNMPSYQSAPGSSSATSYGDEVMDDVDAEYEQVGQDNEVDENNENNQDNNQGGEDEYEEYHDYYLDIDEDMYVAVDIKLEWGQDGELIPTRDEDQQYAHQHGEEGFVDDGKCTYWFVDGEVIVSDIRQRQYCTQECLLGLSDGASLDQACPNIDKHGDEHISNLEFLRMVQSQLARTRHVSGCCVSLDLQGSLGAMFKVMIPSHGYTFVAKGVTEQNVPRLLREADTYTRLRDVQGGCVPVYLGIVQLEAAFDHDSTAYSHFMLLSWAGRPVENLTESQASHGFVNSTRRAYTELHNAGLVHNDAELRNMLYNPQLDRIMLVDFEHASIYECHVAEFQYRNYHATIEEVEDEEAGGSSSNNDGRDHIHNHTPGHSHGGGLRRVSRCENLRREFEVASERELSRAVNLMENLAPTLRPWHIV